MQQLMHALKRDPDLDSKVCQQVIDRLDYYAFVRTQSRSSQ